MSYLFDRQTHCRKQPTCPRAGTCHRDLDRTHVILMSVVNVGLVATGLIATAFNLHPDWMIVIGVFYAAYLVYLSIDLYLWRKSTSTCYSSPVKPIYWLPPHEK
jgi:hypothetical protein